MKVSECMTWEVLIADPGQTIRDAARAIRDSDIGILPVGEGDHLVGIVTDRDIAVRGVAEGLSPNTPIRDVMSLGVKYCFADQDVEEVLENMGEIQIRRLPVLDRDKQLVGIVALTDLVAKADGPVSSRTAATLNAITAPGGAHSQAP